MKMRFNVQNKTQPDPYIFADGNKLYLYVTANDGVEAYSGTSLADEWQYEGVVMQIENAYEFWAPSIICIDGTYYMYVSCVIGDEFEHMYVAKSDNPLGPFVCPKKLYNKFSIDSHMVQTEAGLFFFYVEDIVNVAPGAKVGAKILVDKFLDPYTPSCNPKIVVNADFDEEIFARNRFGDGRDWYTIEGPFFFAEGDYQYIIYSGGCFENDTYHLGYAVAKTTEQDLTKVEFVKHTKDGKFDPLLIRNNIEEGTGHNSVIKIDGQYYIVYHARDAKSGVTSENYSEKRTARFCKLHVADGELKAELMY